MKKAVDAVAAAEEPANSAGESFDAPERPAVTTGLGFDRVELAGAFGDLGTLLPIVVGMILINKLSPTVVFLLGVIVFIMVLALLDNKKMLAALVALGVGIAAGLALGGQDALCLLCGPTEVRVVTPTLHDFWIAFIMLILPQIPLTIGNACVGTADTCSTLFPDNPLLSKASAGRFALTMALANLPTGLFGGGPMCHGTGGLAAHFRFGARTGGAPIMIGALFVVMALAFGELGFGILSIIPNSVLGGASHFCGS